MRDQRTESDPANEDAAYQRVVLDLILEVHPTQLTEAELIREASADTASFARDDALECAIRDLVRVGLLHRHGEFVVPTRAAVFLSELWDEVS
jgi:hypothetical protein